MADEQAPGEGRWWRRSEQGVVLRLRVQPGARRSRVVGVLGDELKVQIAARAVDGKANDALLRWLADTLGVRRGDLELRHGDRSRSKVVAVRDEGVDPEQLVQPR